MRLKAQQQQEEKKKKAEEEVEKSEFARIELAEMESRYKHGIWSLKEHLLKQLYALKVSTG